MCICTVYYVSTYISYVCVSTHMYVYVVLLCIQWTALGTSGSWCCSQRMALPTVPLLQRLVWLARLSLSAQDREAVLSFSHLPSPSMFVRDGLASQICKGVQLYVYVCMYVCMLVSQHVMLVTYSTSSSNACSTFLSLP